MQIFLICDFSQVHYLSFALVFPSISQVWGSKTTRRLRGTRRIWERQDQLAIVSVRRAK
jgi:hypothetical protein